MALFNISGEDEIQKIATLETQLSAFRRFQQSEIFKSASTNDPAGFYNRAIEAARASGLSDDLTFGMLGTAGSSLFGRINIEQPFFRDLANRSFVSSPEVLRERFFGLRGAVLDARSGFGDVPVSTLPVVPLPSEEEEEKLMQDPLIAEEVARAKEARNERISIRQSFLNLPAAAGNLLSSDRLSDRSLFLGV